jgi:hypothetical protein
MSYVEILLLIINLGYLRRDINNVEFVALEEYALWFYLKVLA